MKLFLGVQERHVHALLEGAAEEHMVRLRGITQRAADQAASDARFKELQHVDEVGWIPHIHTSYKLQPGLLRSG